MLQEKPEHSGESGEGHGLLQYQTVNLRLKSNGIIIGGGFGRILEA